MSYVVGPFLEIKYYNTKNKGSYTSGLSKEVLQESVSQWFLELPIRGQINMCLNMFAFNCKIKVTNLTLITQESHEV